MTLRCMHDLQVSYIASVWAFIEWMISTAPEFVLNPKQGSGSATHQVQPDSRLFFSRRLSELLWLLRLSYPSLARTVL